MWETLPVAFIEVNTLWPCLLALLVAVLFVMAEVLIPSHGILSLLAVASIVASLVMAATLGTTAFLVMFLMVVVLMPVVIGISLKYWPKTYFGRRVFLGKPKAGDTPSHSEAAGLDRERFVDKIGKTLTRHSPGGATELDGRRIDTVTEGMMLDAGQYVRVIAVQGNRVVIRALPPGTEADGTPPSEDLGEIEIDDDPFGTEAPEKPA